MRSSAASLKLVLACLALAACTSGAGGSGAPGTGNDGSTGGARAAGSGGTTASGGSGGQTTSEPPRGGASGGVMGTGGLHGSGGALGTGGAQGSGGTHASGGMVGTGGAPGFAGTSGTASGGMPATGGASPGTAGTHGSGGAPATGGAHAAGGTQGSGGMLGSGGAPGPGGTSSASGGAPAAGGTTGTPSSGCSIGSPPTGTTIDGMMMVGTNQRTYRLSVPADYVAGQPLPLVFVFNGVGGTGPQAQQGFKVETGHRAIFIYPTALPNSQTPGQIAWDFSLTGVDVPFFDALVMFLTQGYCVDTTRIFALGASSGAIMSNMLGCFRGDVLRAIAPSSGMDWQQGGCKGDVAVMVICGAQDTFNPCDDATNGAVSETNVWLPQNSCGATTAAGPFSDICVSYQGCKAADPVLLCTQPGGHGWPTSNGDFWWQFFMSL